ncbi:hypothetical protein LAZ67_1000544 [Cordylochernes scorpioides]|uniref:Transposase n=1 Tax=Cordylochernes scorpioides TaxID=51811 RepID=A0ABY6JVT3_9ARAC|nr:hypothetical protein LAZ67_1000544 [Cordylochernes scorpioides]
MSHKYAKQIEGSLLPSIFRILVQNFKVSFFTVISRVSSCFGPQNIARRIAWKAQKTSEKVVHYDYPKRWATYGYPGRASLSMVKPNIHGGNIMLCIWWDQLGVVYYELLQLNKSITGEVY